MKYPIGVFDSGIGGLTVLKELVKELPYEDFIYYGDNSNAPYGHRPVEEIKNFSEDIIGFLLEKKCKTIVIACNTATAAAIHDMRNTFSVPIIGLEPAVKPACISTKTKNIGVLATEGTFRGNHFKTTSEKYKNDVTIHLQVAKNLVELAEASIFSGEKVEKVIKTYLTPLLKENIDQIVLGCTHYAFFYDEMQKIAGAKIKIIDSAIPVSNRTKNVLEANNLLETSQSKQNIIFYTSGDIEKFTSIVNEYLSINNPEVTHIRI
ncbi:glutamate racemase [Bacteroidales bacterium OttesenSCG-928-I21]|nr:glutamate racemase [Bacteroidales bacterium OttesenSCG-928-I21]